jgi:hypothetical protein
VVLAEVVLQVRVPLEVLLQLHQAPLDKAVLVVLLETMAHQVKVETLSEVAEVVVEAVETLLVLLLELLELTL